MTVADLVGTVIDGRYRITDEIARGGMGVVYRAERLKLGRALAIKFLLGWTDTGEARERFVLEAKAMSQLHHPNVVTVTDFGVHDGVPYLVMDFIHGVELLDILEDGAVEEPRAVGIAESVLAGLAHAHDRGIIHRDIKPANVMVHETAGFDDEVLLLDFGVARLRGHTSTLTDGMAIGTPAYMAPEQSTGAVVDARTDIYAVGVLLYHMLTGRKPFDHDDNLELLRLHREAPRPGLAEFAHLEPVVHRAMAIDPADRYQSAAAMANALRGARPAELAGDEGTPVTATLPRRPSTPPLIAGRRNWLIAGGIVGALFLVIVAVVAAQSGASDSAEPPRITAEEIDPDPTSELPGLREAVELAARDNRAGTKQLEAMARAHPDFARAHYELGRAYFARPWWPKGFASYRRAIALDPALAADPEVIRDAVRGLTSRSSHGLAERFITEVIGARAMPALRELEAGTGSTRVRARVQRVIEALQQPPATP